MDIIDSHTHVGSCRVFDAEQSPEQLLNALDSTGIHGAIVQPYPGSTNIAADHDLIAEMAHDHPGRIFGMASINPHMSHTAYRQELTRCVEELGFVGVKLHPLGHAVAPTSRDGELVFRTAADLDTAVMIHTGPGAPFADPAAWVPMINRYPSCRVVLAHAGAGFHTPGAIGVATVCENVTLETSWCKVPDIARAIKLLGPDRVMFGSDNALNIRSEIASYESIGLSAEDLQTVMAGAASAVFRLPSH